MIKDNNYYTVQGWMMNKLHLKGSELGVYAIIYGFTQNSEDEFRGSVGYIAEFLDISYRTVLRMLQSLVQRGYIKKTDNFFENGKSNGYSCVPLEIINLDKTQDVGSNDSIVTQDVALMTKCHKDNEGAYDKMSQGVGQNVTRLMTKCHKGQSQLNILNINSNFNNVSMYERKNKLLKEKVNQDKEKEKPRIESYEEVMDGCGVHKKRYRDIIWEFIKHCQLNGRKVTNDKLYGILVKLDIMYSDDDDKIRSLQTAINAGYYDIRDNRISHN